MKSLKFPAILTAALFLGSANLGAASITLVDIYKNIVYTQTSGAAPTIPTTFFANEELTSGGANDFSAVSVAGPAGTVALTAISTTFFGDATGFASQAAMDAAIPFGTYTFTATETGSATTQTASVVYSEDAFAAAIPALAAVSFNALNGLDPSAGFTAFFNSFTPHASATEGFAFLTIRTSGGGAVVYSTGFLPPSSTSAFIAANTLAANTAYDFELDFSDRIGGINQGINTLLGFDRRTGGSFTTGSVSATPEPASMALAALGLAGVACMKRRKA